MQNERSPKKLSDVLKAGIGKEFLSPAEEWEKSKKLIFTLYDSGATRLLWQLNEYINSDPRLSGPVRGYRVELYNFVNLRSEETLAIARADEKAKYFIGDSGEDNTKFEPSAQFARNRQNPPASLPYASSRLYYNHREVEVREGDKLVTKVESDLLQAYCTEEETVRLLNGYWFNGINYTSREITIPNASKNTEAVYEALGKLYDEKPALPYNFRRSNL